MKILFITTNLLQKSNSAAIRNGGLISGLLGLGHEVEVITISVDQGEKLSLKLKSEIKLTEIDLGLDNLKSVKKKLYAGKERHIFFKFLVRIISFLKDIYFFPDHYKNFIKKTSKLECSDFDLLISSSDMKSSHYAALSIFKNNTNKKWIQIWGDPWYRDINLKFYFKKFIKFKERRLLKYASKVVYVSDLTCRQSKLDYPKIAEKMYYVPRSYSAEIENVKNVNVDEISILYAGIIGPNRDLKSFLTWNDLNNSIFHLSIFGQLSLEEKEKYSIFNNVYLGNPIEYDEVLNKFLEVDTLLMISNKGDAAQIPGKFFDYLGTNLPIICLVEDKLSDFSVFVSSFESVILISYEELKNNSVHIDQLIDFISKRFTPNILFSPKEVALQILNKV